MNTEKNIYSDKIVLDLETKKGFSEVGRANFSLLGVSVVGIYSYAENNFYTFQENQIKKLIPYLQRAQLIIGFNIKRFDYPVLQPYLNSDLCQLNTLDILEEVQNSLGFRLSLDSIAKATLEIGKIGTGLDALRYFRQGQMDKLAQYCQHDVFVTRQLYEYGRQQGHLLYFRATALETIPVNWSEVATVVEILNEAHNKNLSVEIEYSAANNFGKKQKRKIDIYNLDFNRLVAYCHLRKQMRTFNIRRVLAARMTNNKYSIPDQF